MAPVIGRWSSVAGGAPPRAIVRLGQLLFAIAITAFGIESLVVARTGPMLPHLFNSAVLPVIPWVPALPWLAYLTGATLVAAGLSLAANRRARLAAAFLGILFLSCVVLRISFVYTRRTVTFELLAIGSAAVVLMGTLPSAGGGSRRWNGVLTPVGSILFAVSLVVFGIDHFASLEFVAGLVPPWIPWHLFWAAFTGASFIAAGVSIATRRMGAWGATLIGTMFLLWFLLLHAPRVLGIAGIVAAPHNPNEWSSAFIALAMCGASWICISGQGAAHGDMRRGRVA